jgi:hypothetical protein
MAKDIISDSGLSIKFDDENKILTLVTPFNNSVVISDLDREITIEDQHGNGIVMSASGITIHSARNITIEAEKDLTLKAGIIHIN